MGLLEWSAVGGIAVAILAIVTVLARLMDRLNKAESKATAAAISAADVKTEVGRVESELVQHRVDVARSYVSKETLASLETRIVEAINRLGDRLDKLFTNQQV